MGSSRRRLLNQSTCKPVGDVCIAVRPFQRRVFNGFEGAPWAATMDDFGFEQAVDRLGQRVVITVADAAD